jgi:hypothetical protein
MLSRGRSLLAHWALVAAATPLDGFKRFWVDLIEGAAPS